MLKADPTMIVSRKDAKSGYAPVNGPQMYYEIHGTGRSLVLLHGGPMTIAASFGTILPSLARTRQVIAVEQQGHGHIADINRPLTFEQMADDTAALLRHLTIAHADVFGYSDGGNVALGIAIRHPDLVLILIDGALCYRGFEPSGPLATRLAWDFTVCTYDRRGHGANTDTQPYGVEREVEDLDALIGEAGRPALIFNMNKRIREDRS